MNCVDPKYKNIIRELHANLSIILRVILCTHQVDIIKFESLVKQTSILIAQKLPWAQLNWTLHRTLHHSVELIRINNGWSIGSLSEEPLEANNKFVRRFLESHARTMSPNEQIQDVMARLLERSCPEVLAYQRRFHDLRKCDICQGRHKTKNHDAYVLDMKSSCLDKYDTMVLEYIY